ncbi:MAG: hypothetical protein ABW223_09720, partial [Rariglobus sp.]
MTKLPLGLAALATAAVLALGGCASKTPATVRASTPPASDLPVKPMEPARADAAAQHAPGWSPTQMTASARYVRINGPLPEAKGALNFLANEAGLKDGTVVLTAVQADAALKELMRVTGQEVQSAPPVTVALTKIAKFDLTENMAKSSEETPGVKIVVGGVEHFFTPRAVGVLLRIVPQAITGSAIQIDAEVQETTFEGFVEYGNQTVSIPAKSNPSGDVAESTTAKVPAGFYQPIFSTHSTELKLNVPVGSVAVL